MNKLLRKISKVLIGLSMAVGVGVAVGSQKASRVDATNDIQVSFPGSPSSYVNSYAKSFTITKDSVTFTFENWNNGQESGAWTEIRGGSKNGAWTGTITSGQISSKVQSVVVSVSTANTKAGASTLEVATNSSFTTGLQTINKAADSTTGDKTYTVTTPTANCYYRLTHNNSKGSSNGEFRITGITFNYASEAPSSTVQSVVIGNAPSSTVTDVNVGTSGPTLTATATMRTGSDVPTFTWDSDNTSAVTVSQSGALTYVGNGTAHITATASLPAGSTSGDTNVGTVTVTTSNLIGSSTNPFTVAQALAVCSSTGDTATTYDCYTTGFVSRVKTDETYSSQYGNKTFWISADGSNSNEIEAYRCLYIGGEKMSEAQFNDIEANDTVTIVGKLINYNNSTPEYTQGCYITAHTKPAVPHISIQESSQTINSGDTLTLHATVGNPVENYSVVWESGTPAVATVGSSTGLVTGVSAGSTSITAKMLDENDLVVATSSAITITVLEPVIVDGDTFIIYAIKDTVSYYLSGISSNLGTCSTTKADAVVFTAEEGETTGQFAFKFGSKYLSYSGSSNAVYTSDENTSNATLWTVENNGTNDVIESVNVTGRKLQYNHNGDTGDNTKNRFACYSSSQVGIFVEKVVPPEVDEVTVYGDATADAEGAVSLVKEFLYEVSYVDVSNPGNSSVSVSVLNSNSTTDGASVTTAPSGGSFSVTFTASDTYTITVTSLEDGTKSDSTTITVSNIYVVQLTNYNSYSGTMVSGSAILTEGDYVFYYNGYAMKASIASNRTQYEEVEPENGAISTDLANIVWHVKLDGDYYTIYNASEEKYLASTGSNNQAKLESSVTDNSRWTVEISEGTFEFVNKARDGVSNNKYLRNNGTYGFACYGSGTGGALSLYKKAYDAVDYSRILVNYLGDVCDASNGNTDTTELTNTWKILAAEYALLTSSVKGNLSDQSESAAVLSALSAYDYVVGKYNKTQGISAINDFMSRNPAAVGGANSLLINSVGNNTNTVAIIVIISLVSVTAIGGYFFIRKRREN